MSSLEFAIVAELNAVASITSLVNGRITPLVRDDDNGPLPAIVYSGSDPIRERYLDGSFSEFAEASMAFEIWATSYIEAKQLSRNVISCLSNLCGVIGTPDTGQFDVFGIDCETANENGEWVNDIVLIGFVATINLADVT